MTIKWYFILKFYLQISTFDSYKLNYFEVPCNISFKEHFLEDGQNKWPKHVAGYAFYNKFTYLYVHWLVVLLIPDMFLTYLSFASIVSQLKIWHFLITGIERNVCRCTFNLLAPEFYI
jgi:hypothetical protein